MNYMGVDIGTSGCKAVVTDAGGRQLGSAYREYDVRFTDDGGAELDSDEVIGKCLEVIAEAASRAPARSVKALAVSSQGEAFTAVGKDGSALCNAMVSSDTRSDPYARSWPEHFGERELYDVTGHTAHPMFTLFKLLWLKENRPEVWRAAVRFLCFEDLLQFRLGLDPAMGWPLAARTMLFDVRRHEWHGAILDRIGLAPSKLARPLPSGSVAGELPEERARELGLADRALVVTGGHDQPCAALGAGVTEAGKAMYATGTVECIAPVFAEAIFDERLRHANLCTYDHTVPGRYFSVAFSLTGGNLLKWFRDEFGAAEVAEAQRSGANAYELLLASAAREPSSLMVLPYFTPSGTPYFDTATKGAILGLRLSTTRGEILRALLEGIAFEMRLNLDLLESAGCAVRELRAVGGGARSAFWTQLKSDVLGKPITVLDAPEGGCLGAAMLACAADTGEPAAAIAEKWVRIASTCAPRSDVSAFYRERFETYRRVYPAIRGVRV